MEIFIDFLWKDKTTHFLANFQVKNDKIIFVKMSSICLYLVYNTMLRNEIFTKTLLERANMTLSNFKEHHFVQFLAKGKQTDFTL